MGGDGELGARGGEQRGEEWLARSFRAWHWSSNFKKRCHPCFSFSSNFVSLASHFFLFRTVFFLFFRVFFRSSFCPPSFRAGGLCVGCPTPRSKDPGSYHGQVPRRADLSASRGHRAPWLGPRTVHHDRPMRAHGPPNVRRSGPSPCALLCAGPSPEPH